MKYIGSKQINIIREWKEKGRTQQDVYTTLKALGIPLGRKTISKYWHMEYIE